MARKEEEIMWDFIKALDMVEEYNLFKIGDFSGN